MAPLEFPRPLTRRERDVLEFLLCDDRRFSAQLQAQANEVRAIGTCDTDGCPCVKLEVDQSAAPRADSVQGVRATAVTDPPDPSHTVWVHLWCKGGWLDYLEVSWLDLQPTELPNTNTLRFD